MATATALMTTEEMLSLPENDAFDRELIRGELRERPMTVRNKVHSRLLVNVAYQLKAWQRRVDDRAGIVLGGEVGAILARDPDSTVGIDVAYFDRNVVLSESGETTLVAGAPIFAIEIMSPSDRIEDIDEKLAEYLAHGVQLVWVISPKFRTVTVYRPGSEPELFNVRETISAAPELPGFECPVAELFE